MRKELGVYLDEFARKDVGAHLAKYIPEEQRSIIDIRHIPTRDLPKKLIVVGGDGSVRVAMEKAHAQQETVIGILPGGTHNAFYKHIVEQGATCSVEKFLELWDQSSFHMYRPGLVRGNVFIVAAGFGGWEVNYAALHKSKKLRKILPRRFQVNTLAVASIFGLLKDARTTQQPVTNSVFAIPQTGSLYAHEPGENQHELLALVKIPGELQAQAVLWGAYVLTYCHITGKPLSSKLHVSFADSFVIRQEEQVQQGRNIDGDWFAHSPHGDILVQRSQKAIPVVALR